MPDSSVLKICPHCGQSVAVSAVHCPSCGVEFTTDDSDFVAYERINTSAEPGNVYAGGTINNLTGSFENLAQPEYDQSYNVDPYYAGNTVANNEESTVNEDESYIDGPSIAEEAAGIAAEDPYAPQARRESPRKHSEDSTQENKSGVIITIVATVLLVAVIATGIAMAFRLGLVGDNEDNLSDIDALMASEDYAAAIEELEKLVANGTATSEDYQLLSDAYNGYGDETAAADALLRGFEATGDNMLKNSAAEAYLKLGNEASNLGNYDAAKEYYELILEKLDSSHSGAIAGLNSLQQMNEDITMQGDATTANQTVIPAASANIAPPEQEDVTASNSSSGAVNESDQVIVTPTPTPTATPVPTVTPTPSPVVTPEPTSEATPEVTPSEQSEEEVEQTQEPESEETKVDFDCYSSWCTLVKSDASYGSAIEAASAEGGSLLTFSDEEGYQAICSQADSLGLVFVWIGATMSDYNAGTFTGNDYWLEGEPSYGENEDCIALVKHDGVWKLIDVSSGDESYSGSRGYVIYR